MLAEQEDFMGKAIAAGRIKAPVKKGGSGEGVLERPSTMTQFVKDESGFRMWTGRNPRGYVLNDTAANGFMLHFGSCPHLYNEKDEARQSGKGKFCSTDKHEVIQHAYTERGVTPVRCKTCNP